MPFGAIASLIGNERDISANRASQKRDIAMQYDFAKNGIGWRVADAVKSGLHPLIGAGVNPISPSPTAIGQSGSAEAFGKLGQDLSRAMNQNRNKQEQEVNQINIQAAKADLDGKIIENQIKASQLAKLKQTPAPGVPTDGLSGPLFGQGDINGLLPPPVELESMRRSRSDPNNSAKEAGFVTDYGFARTPSGVAVVPSKDVKDRIDDTLIPSLQWSLRNTHVFDSPPTLDPRLYPLPKGAKSWRWNAIRQEFQPDWGDKNREKLKRFHLFNIGDTFNRFKNQKFKYAR